MANHRKQHYIPQLYLKKFSPNQKQIFLWEKITGKKTYDSVSNVCQLKHFYKFPDSTIDTASNMPVDSLYAESTYFDKNIEVKYGNMLNTIISNKERWVKDETTNPLNFNEKYEFARLIAIQWFRLKSFSDSIDSLETSFIDGVLDLFTEGLEKEQNITIDHEERKTELVESLKGNTKLNHANFGYMNEDLIDIYANAITQNYWQFYVSKNNDIYTSDFPITVYPHQKDVRPICEGLASYGTELSFPISRDILLVIWDKEYFNNKNDKDCCFSFIGTKERIKNNNLRYIYAKRHLYSYDGQYNDIII